ncbi:MAG: family 10 glycosylhydrolase, partial [Candidatus Latescibacterota bacterium]
MAGIAFNEDSSHYFGTRAGQKLDARIVQSWVDQYADTQVTEMMLNPNAMRTSYASKVWDPIWRGYDPDAGDDQPLLAGSSPEERIGARKWIHTAWQLHHDGIDVYQLWIARCRKRSLSPWISMRMNDVHYADNENSFIQGELWRRRPDLRRVTYRSGGWDENAFDYGKPEVRQYHMALIQELAERYDFDGFELDWMRFRHHFRPGYEAEGTPLLTEFTADVRRLLDEWEQKRGHRIQLGARVASRPQTALGFGMDAATWARRGLIDMLVICPHWNSIEPDMPVEVWKQLLEGTNVLLAA